MQGVSPADGKRKTSQGEGSSPVRVSTPAPEQWPRVAVLRRGLDGAQICRRGVHLCKRHSVSMQLWVGKEERWLRSGLILPALPSASLEL